MIIFYNKTTGEIQGTIDGRIHNEDHLKMWVGDKNKTDRLICNWVVVKQYKDEKGKVIASDYEPENNKEAMFLIDQRKADLRDYKVDLETKTLVKK